MTFDPIHYKTTTRQQWQDYAGGWNDWAPLLETWLGEATERMLDLAGVTTGSRVLDVAAGAGGQSIAAARRVGPTGTRPGHRPVSRRSWSYAAERPQAERAGQRLHAASSTASSSTSSRRAAFDAAISRVGLIYFPDRHAGADRHPPRPPRRRPVRHRHLLHRGDQRLLLAAGLDHPGAGPAPAPAAGPARTVQPRRPRACSSASSPQPGSTTSSVEVVEAPGPAALGRRVRPLRAGVVRCAPPDARRAGRPTTRTLVWDEIETALGQYDTADGFVGPCELVIAGATR